MMIYSQDNVSNLVKRIGNEKSADYLSYYHDKLRTDLQVHTQGKLYTKVVSVFKNEEKESSQFVLDTYESITKGSIHRGIDNLSRIFNNTGFDITGSQEVIDELSSSGFFASYIDDFISISTAIDPNTIQVWIKKDDEWVSKFVQSNFVQFINQNEVCFILEEESDYTLRKSNSKVVGLTHEYGRYVSNSYYEGVEYVWGERVTYIYISKNQYIKTVKFKSDAEVDIENFKKPLLSPYSYTGVEKIEKGVYNSAVAGFIPFGNHALIQHRTYRSIEAIFGYPRMSEVELPCENCIRGMENCDPCEEFPEGIRTCRTCHGSGHVSLQSPFKIYKRKLFPDAPELNANIKPVEFFTPDIAILQYNATAWKETLQMGEDAIYIQQRVETGNVESAQSREKQLESMYSWLGRISNVIYGNLQLTLDNYCIIVGGGGVVVNKPISFAIMNELEAFQYLNSIVAADAPVFIKTSHIENFLNKYISKTSSLIKIVDVLKRVDPFVFYTTKDLQTLSDSGVINDKDWRIHSYAFPILSQMITREPEMLELSYEQIEKRLLAEINKKVGIRGEQSVLINEVQENELEEELEEPLEETSEESED